MRQYSQIGLVALCLGSLSACAILAADFREKHHDHARESEKTAGHAHP
jgi:hypothetical protein